MALLDIVSALQAKAAALPGIKAAPLTPPEDLLATPFAVAYLEEVKVVGLSAGLIRQTGTVVVELHGLRQNLPQAVATMTPYGDSFPAALLADPTLGGTIPGFQHIGLGADVPLSGQFGHLEYGATKTIGWKFHIPFKWEGAPS